MSSQSPASLLPRHEAFLHCAPVDRPLLGAWVGGYYPAEQFPRGHGSWQVGQLLRPADVCFEAFRQDYETLCRLHQEAEDDFFYVGSAYWGIPWLEAILGCAIHVGQTSCWAARGSASGWQGPSNAVVPVWGPQRQGRDTLAMDLTRAGNHRQAPKTPLDAATRPTLDLQSNAWFQCLLQFTRDLVQFAAARFPVCAPLLRGPGDAASALCGPEAVAMALIDGAPWMGELLAYCAQVRLEVLKQLNHAIPAWCGTHAAAGYPSKLWTTRTVAYYQEDSAAIVNPRLFVDHLLPLARRTKSLADVHFIHLHSSCLYLIDALLADDTFTVVEVNLDHPGSSPPLAQYLPALRKIQLAGRPLLLWGDISPSDWELLQRELSPVGLSVQPIILHPEDIRRYR